MVPADLSLAHPAPVHFRPERGWVGDVIPFWRGGRIWLFYLLEVRDEPTSGTGWALVSTDDFVTYQDHGVVLPSGGPSADDHNCYTGSLVDTGDTVHLFYTGNNPHHLADNGLSQLQVVMHATSTGGLDTWHKHPDHTFAAPPGYDPADWRDPFVFRVDDDEPWRMLLAARHLEGPERRRGVVAQLTSNDLESWTLTKPFWDPRRYVTQECPEVFRDGDWWYLVYSEFSDAFTTRYRISRSPDGPWMVPDHDTIDGRAFYAAKSVARGGRRFFIGWIATRAGSRDDGPWQWAGTMSVLESTQRPDGTLAFSLPHEITDSFGLAVPMELADVDPVDPADEAANSPRLSAPDSYRARVSDVELPEQFLATMTVEIEPGTREVGVLLRCSDDGDETYVLRLEPHRSRLVFDRWPRQRTGGGQWEISGDHPFVIELERPCHLPSGQHLIELVIDETTCVAVIDRQVVLSARLYDRTTGRLGVFVGEGAATFSSITVCRRAPDVKTEP